MVLKLDVGTNLMIIFGCSCIMMAALAILDMLINIYEEAELGIDS